ncbi:MAG: hypothetical protein SWY16_11770 [Cyanobacteriota bacterium]|nr:hypothetical protein [Cyanobacteriota bacterium]
MSHHQSSDTNPIPAIANPFFDGDNPANRMILMGTPQWIRSVIHRLHCLGVAEVGNWSPVLPVGKSGEAMSILKRPRRNNVTLGQ